MYSFRQENRREWYENAQLCRNGHLVNYFVTTKPHENKKFCDECGEPTLTACEYCNTPLQGFQHNSGGFSYKYIAPRFCRECGKMYPWTADRMNAARELVYELNLTATEQEEMEQSIRTLVAQDNPRTQVAIVKFKRLAAKAGIETAGMFRDILVDVISETAKKALFP